MHFCSCHWMTNYNCLPFGMASAPSIFQRHIDSVPQGMKHTSAYIDDNIVTGVTPQEHLQNLEQVLKRFEASGLRLNKNKCFFLHPIIVYLSSTLSPLYSLLNKTRNGTEVRINKKRFKPLKLFYNLILYWSIMTSKSHSSWLATHLIIASVRYFLKLLMSNKRNRLPTYHLPYPLLKKITHSWKKRH